METFIYCLETRYCSLYFQFILNTVFDLLFIMNFSNFDFCNSERDVRFIYLTLRCTEFLPTHNSIRQSGGVSPRNWWVLSYKLNRQVLPIHNSKRQSGGVSPRNWWVLSYKLNRQVLPTHNSIRQSGGLILEIGGCCHTN